MKLKTIAVFWLLVGTPAVFGLEAITTHPPQPPSVRLTANATNGAGFGFRATTNLLITSLGYQFITNSYSTGKVTIFNHDWVELRSSIVSTNSPKQGQGWYEPIPPIVFPTGSTGFILGYDHGWFPPESPEYWRGNVYYGTNDFSVAAGLEFLNGALGAQIISPRIQPNCIARGRKLSIRSSAVASSTRNSVHSHKHCRLVLAHANLSMFSSDGKCA
jgi:hypothetical protein